MIVFTPRGMFLNLDLTQNLTLTQSRYNKLLSTNEAGYNQTAIRNTTNFNTIPGKYAVMHGTGDDNVHYQNTAALVDLLVGEAVSPDRWQMMAFTDSDHSITYNGANQWIYRYLTKQLYEEKNRNPSAEPLIHQWRRREKVFKDA